MSGPFVYVNELASDLTELAAKVACFVGGHFDDDASATFNGHAHDDASPFLGDFQRTVASPRLESRHRGSPFPSCPALALGVEMLGAIFPLLGQEEETRP